MGEPLKFRRYNKNKKGSFEVNVWFFDHEVSAIIGALRLAQKHHQQKNNRAYVSFLKSLEKKMSKILGELLKKELKDLDDEKLDKSKQDSITAKTT